MDVSVFADEFTQYEKYGVPFCDVVNLGSFYGDDGFCDRLLCGNCALR